MGLDVLSEKPVGFDAAAIERLGERAAGAGRVLAVGFWRRTAWPYVEARRLVAEGAIGTPTFLRSSQWDADLPPLAFADPEVSGGVEVDCGVHEADLARWFLGCEIAQVSATGTPGALAEVGDAETVAALAVTTAGQAVAIDLGRTCGYDDDVRTEILGPGGALLIDARGPAACATATATACATSPAPTATSSSWRSPLSSSALPRHAGARSRTRRRPTPPARSRRARPCAARAWRAAPWRCSR